MPPQSGDKQLDKAVRLRHRPREIAARAAWNAGDFVIAASLATLLPAAWVLRVAPRIPARRGVARYMRLRRRMGPAGAMPWLRAKVRARRSFTEVAA